MEITKQYLTNIHTLLDTLMETQSDAIDRAVAAVADTLAQDGMAYEEDILRKNRFDFKLADVVKNDSQKRIALTQEQESELNYNVRKSI